MNDGGDQQFEETKGNKVVVIQQERDGTLHKVDADEFDFGAPGHVFIGIESMIPTRPKRSEDIQGVNDTSPEQPIEESFDLKAWTDRVGDELARNLNEHVAREQAEDQARRQK